MKTAITKFEKKNDLLEVFVYMSWLHDTTLRSGLVQENQYGMDRKVLFLALLVFLEDIWCHGFMYQTILKSNNGKGFGEPALRTRRIVPGTISPAREVPQHILRPHYVNLSNRYSNHDDEDIPFLENQRIAPADRATIDRMRKAGILAREVLNAAIESVAIGVTTDEIDAVVHKSTIERNCYPSPLGYKGFPKSCCTSVNEVMCHGIPDSTKLQNGDIVNIDVTLFFEGVHADCSETVIVGNAEPTVRKLVDTASKALQAAIKCCGPGVSYNTIGDVIERIVKRNGFSIATDFVGHG